MQRPRNRNRPATFVLTRHALGRFAACLLVFSLLGATGCRDDSGRENARQAAEYRRQLDASGKRVLIVDAQGSQQVKLRKRRDQIKVYGEDLKALGYVRWSVAKPDDKSAAPVAVRVQTLGTPDASPILPVEQAEDSGRIVELAGHFRIVEQLPTPKSDAPSAWRVLGADKKVIGIFQKLGENEWQLLTDPKKDASSAAVASDFEADFRVKDAEAGERMRLVRDTKVVATVEF